MRPPVLFRYLDKYCRHSEEAGDCNTEFGMRKAELLLSFRAGGGKDFFVIQSLRQQAKNPPRWFVQGNDHRLPNPLSFSRFARESPGWLPRETTTYLSVPPWGIPRPAASE